MIKCRHDVDLTRNCRKCNSERYDGLATKFTPVDTPAMDAPQVMTRPHPTSFSFSVPAEFDPETIQNLMPEPDHTLTMRNGDTEKRYRIRGVEPSRDGRSWMFDLEEIV